MITLIQKTVTLLLTSIAVFCFAQVKISGKVTSKNKGVKEVSVTLKDTYDGATTDENGNYSFETTEKGNLSLVFEKAGFEKVEKPITIADQSIVLNTELKTDYADIEAVTITAGVVEASDKKRGTSLSAIDVYTTAGTDGQLSAALNFRPGVQKVGETEGLFIRGGSSAETKIFMDGSLINNYFTNSVPGIAGRDRFDVSLFKGNVFSSGGYSAQFGQALSGVLILESVDLVDQSSYDFGVSPIFISGGFQRLNKAKNASFGANVGYSNLGLITKVLDFDTDFSKVPRGFNSDFNFRIKTKGGGFLKYYGSFDNNSMAVQSPSLETDADETKVNLKGLNTYHNLSFKQKFGKYSFNAGTSYSINKNDLDFSTISNGIESHQNEYNTDGNYFNFKTMVERKVAKISTIRAGLEFNNSHETNNYNKNYKDLISSFFAETDLAISRVFSAKVGVRAETSSYLDKTNISPRLAFGYKISKDWTASLATGIFYQNPESKYLNSDAPLTFQKASHYIFQVQKSSEGRLLRLEAFYKDYEKLIKTLGNQYVQTAVNNDGNGYAKGLEFLWKDNKSIPSIDYWVSYSYLDTKRNSLNHPISLTPNFATDHTLSLVAKKFVVKWKTGLNISYTYASGRPYYDIITDNGQNILRHQGTTKNYNAANFSVNFLPNIGKKDAKAFAVYVLSISNILGSKNVYGYNFSQDGLRSSAIIPPVKRFVFIGAFISFGVDKTEAAINGNL